MLLDLRRLSANEVRVTPQSSDDLWVLSQIIEPGDLARGRTDRKEKAGGNEERAGRILRTPMTLTLEVEKSEWEGDSLRLLGLIRDGPPDVPRGAHHTLETTRGADLTIIKPAWPAYQLQRLRDAAAAQAQSLLVLLFDREEGLLAWVAPSGITTLATYKGAVAKKDQPGQAKGEFFAEIGAELARAAAQRRPHHIVAASPAFWAAPFRAALPAILRDRVLHTICSDVSEAAIGEVLRRPELQTILESSRLAQETAWLDDLLAAIVKDRACWGLADCADRAQRGAVATLLVSARYLAKLRVEGQFAPLDALLHTVEGSGGAIHLVSTPAVCDRLDGLGGVAGLLRWT